MKWIISLLIMLVHVLHRHWMGEMEWNVQGKDITYGILFHLSKVM
jgi:hypothetical protein